jgi:hypothetical protein
MNSTNRVAHFAVGRRDAPSFGIGALSAPNSKGSDNDPA